MINYTSGNELYSALRARAEKPLNSLVEKSEQKQRVSTKNLKKCLKAAQNSHLKLSAASLEESRGRLRKVLKAQNSKKYKIKEKLINEIIKHLEIKGGVGENGAQDPYGTETQVIAQPVADSRLVALSHAGSRLSEAESHMSEKKISPDAFQEIHEVNSYDNGNERIEPSKKESLAEPEEESIAVVNDDFDDFNEAIKKYTTHLDEVGDEIDIMIKKYRKSEEIKVIEVIKDLDEIYDNQEANLHSLRRISKEKSDLKKQEKIASIKEYQSKIGEELDDIFYTIHKLGSAQYEFFIDAKLTRDKLIYALNDSYDALDRLNLPS